MAERLLLALTDVRDDFISDTLSFLGYDRPESGKKARSGRQKWGVVLLAAALAALLAATAFGLDLFGIRSFLVPFPLQAGEGGYISTNGFRDTPEGRAAAEWADFVRTYDISGLSDEKIEAWIGDSPEQRALERIYGVYDDAMAQKLVEIQDTYDLTLHSQVYSPASEELFRSAAGISSFLRTEESRFQGQYLYEDGSFKGEGVAVVDRADCPFTLIRGRKGVLAPFTNYLSDPGDYSEWQYTTSLGAGVDAAWFPTGGALSPCFLFYSEGEYQITVYGSVPEGKDAVNRFAECFDYAALCAGTPRIEVLQKPEETDTGTAGSPDWAAFTASPEWQAAQEFSAFCSADEGRRDPLIQSRALHGRGDAVLDAEMERLCAKYGLVSPTYKEFYANYYGSNRAYPYEGNGVPDGAEWYSISQEEFWDLLGTGELFEREGVPVSDWYDTGAFYTGFANTDIYYMPRGVLFTYPVSLPENFRVTEQWEHSTPEGAAVTCIQTNRPEGLLLYDTGRAYVLIVTHSGREPANIQTAAEQISFLHFR